MNKKTLEILEFNKIIETLKEYAVSDIGLKLIDQIKPSVDVFEIERWLTEVTETKKLLTSGSSVPLHSLKGLDNIISNLGKNPALKPAELSSIALFAKECGRMKKFLHERLGLAPMAASYGESLHNLPEIYDEVHRCIIGDHVVDNASGSLQKIRKKMNTCDQRIKSKVNSTLKSTKYSTYLQDKVVSMRYGRYVIPVKSEYRAHVKGSVIDKSSTGSTLFIEPAEIKKLQDEMNLLKIEEDKEVYQILCYLTGIVEESSKELKINMEIMGHYDFLFAKGKYSRSIDGNQVNLNENKAITIKDGRHPLLGKAAVPLNFHVGDKYKALVITGPNTGGKTVTLKTVGLFTLMVQCGLHVSASPESDFSPFMSILVDIGDGQSIENSLSTFSSHITNIIDIIDSCDSNSLVIMDEVGTGTDPSEGMGLATAILEKVYEKGSTLLATTHFNEIKDFACNHNGFENGSMGFDINTLKPKYQLNIGKSGDSNAFLIALRLGMSTELIERAHNVAYKEEKSYDITFTSDTQEDSSPKSEDIQVRNISKASELSKKKKDTRKKFQVGDCVYVKTLGGLGIVTEMEDRKGMVTVLYKKKKIKVNHKRLSLHIDKKELYPEDYDMKIVTETKENRKKERILNKRHEDGIEIQR